MLLAASTVVFRLGAGASKVAQVTMRQPEAAFGMRLRHPCLYLLALAGMLPCLATTSGCHVVHKVQADYHLDRGEKLLAQDNLDRALVEFEKASQLSPKLAAAPSRMGTIYRRMGDYEHAIACFLEAIRRNPFSFDDTLNLAQLYHFSSRLRDAVQAYLHATELQPDHFEAQLNLGACYQQLGDYDQAVERFERAIAVDPDQPSSYVNLGVTLDSQGKYYEAIRAYKEALERDNRQPLVLVNLAHTYVNQNRLKLARGTLQRAVRMDPQLGVAHEALGYCLFRMRDFDAAEVAYRDAIACDKGLTRSYAGLGSICMLRYLEDATRTDVRAEALEYWHRSLEVDPDQPRIRKLIARYESSSQDPDTVLLSDRQTPTQSAGGS